jgi:hypothetical protein
MAGDGTPASPACRHPHGRESTDLIDPADLIDLADLTRLT